MNHGRCRGSPNTGRDWHTIGCRLWADCCGAGIVVSAAFAGSLGQGCDEGLDFCLGEGQVGYVVRPRYCAVIHCPTLTQHHSSRTGHGHGRLEWVVDCPGIKLTFRFLARRLVPAIVKWVPSSK